MLAAKLGDLSFIPGSRMRGGRREPAPASCPLVLRQASLNPITIFYINFIFRSSSCFVNPIQARVV